MSKLTTWLAALIAASSLLFSLYTVLPFLRNSLSTNPDSALLHPSSCTRPAPLIPTPPPAHESPLLRSPLSHHYYAALFDRLHRRHPIRIAILGGSISARDGWHTRHKPEMRYFNTLLSFFQRHFPVTPVPQQTNSNGGGQDGGGSGREQRLHKRLTAFDRLFPADDPQKAAPVWSHKLLNLASGGTGSQSTSFCWTSLLTDAQSGVILLPDLLLLDYAVNDAFVGLPGAMVQLPDNGTDSAAGAARHPTLPLSALHSIDRLVRSLLMTAMQSQQSVAILPLYFVTGHHKQHGSAQLAHDRVARHYGLPSVSFRDFLLHPLTRQLILAQPPLTEYPTIYEEDSYHPGPEGHRWVAALLQRTLLALHDNYHHSQRASLADTWALSGRVASSSYRLRERPTRRQQGEADDNATTVEEEGMEDSWRWETDVEEEAVAEWQRKVMKGEEREEFILPPIRSLHPLPLPPAFHPLNQDLPASFHCKQTYPPYLPLAWSLRFEQVERWFGLLDSSEPPPAGLPPITSHANTSRSLQWQFSSPPKHQHKFTLSPNPAYLTAVTQQAGGGEGTGRFPLPHMTVAFPQVVSHSVSVFYLRTPHVMACAEAWLWCSRQPEVRSEVVVLNGTWTSPASQATVSTVYMVEHSSPPCFDRMHLRLMQAGEFHVIGYAVT